VLEGNTTTLSATTDADGKFVFANLAPGSYQVRLVDGKGNAYQGLMPQTVAVTAGQAVQVVMQVPRPYVPVREPCCKPYGAPPARRRVV
jgi:hypothetical protein